MFIIVFPAQENIYEPSFFDTILIPFFVYNMIFFATENGGEHISTQNHLLYLQNQISSFWPIFYCSRKLKIGVAGGRVRYL